VTGVEVRSCFLDGERCDVFGQKRVQRLGGSLRRGAVDRVDARDLTEGVDAGVRSPGDRKTVNRAVRFVERVPQLAFHGAQARLGRPPTEPRPVVFEGQLQPHGAYHRRVADEDWRVEVELDDAEHGYSLSERLRAGDLDDEARERLGESVVVSRDGSRLFLYAATEDQAREAARVVGDLLASDDLTAEVTTARWHPVEQEWKDPSIPLPASGEEVEEELERREAAEEQEAERTGSWDWHVRVELPSRSDAVELARRLEGDGHRVHRRWRYVTVDVATEETARELAGTMPEGAEVTVETKPPDPVFVFLESRGV
jgi:hypothetical protein